MLIGDLIEDVRTLIPDQPPTMGVPAASVSFSYAVPGSSLPSDTYWVVVTQFNPWGETLASSEFTGAIASGGGIGIQVNCPFLPGAVRMRVYLCRQGLGGGPGLENAFIESYVNPFAIGIYPTNSGYPPGRSSAYLPDLDGPTFSATYLFNLLNRALQQACVETGGIKDYSGVGTISGNPFYTLQGQWNAITDLWYNGYWMQGGDRGWFFRRNTISSQILTSASVSIQDNRTIIEVYPQPDRTAGTTTLNVGCGASDASIQVANPGFALLPFGFLQIDSEIMGYFGKLGNTLQVAPRGIGGQPAQPHLAGATVQELNLFFAGRRQFAVEFTAGESLDILAVPQGWKSLLTDYMMYRIRENEQEEQKADSYYKAFLSKCKTYAAQNKQVMKRRQIGMPASPQSFFNTPTGGLLLP